MGDTSSWFRQRWSGGTFLVLCLFQHTLTPFSLRHMQSVIQKALIHFRLDLPFDDLVLVTYLDGEKLEVTDDVLKHLSEQATVELMLLPPSKGEEPKATIPEPQYQDTGPSIGDLYDPSPPHPSLPPPSPLPSVDT